MVPLILAEDTVYTLIAMFTNEPHQIREWVEGTGLDAEISDIIQDMQEAFNTRNFEKFHELEATLADLEKRNEEAVKGHWEYEDTGLTVGAYFMSLDDAGKREYLKTRDIRIGNAPKRDGVPGVRVVIDGEDYGVICMTKASS
jgi:hypothetical protein